MTGPNSNDTDTDGHTGGVALPGLSGIDLGELSGQLSQLTGSLEQLQSDNQVLSDALTDTQRRLKQSREAERLAQELAADARRDRGRADAAVDRRQAEIEQLEAEVTKLRSERADWESVILAERDAAIEEQVAELVAARADVRALNAHVADLEDELSLERQRTAPDTHIVQLMTTAGTTLLVDGESLVLSAWPELSPERRRSRVIEAAGRFHRRHGVTIELLLAGADGWEPTEPAPPGVRVRVPHEGIPIPACLGRLGELHGQTAPIVTVSSTTAEEPWISTARAAALMGLPVPPEPQHNHTTTDLKPATEVEK